jgi:hypothetical protein
MAESAAAQAYDIAALKIRGHNSQTNFPIQQYLDDQGELPVDEHLDDTIAELKAAAARQLLEDLDSETGQEVNACDTPADAIELIKQRLGSRRLTGLQEELMVVLLGREGKVAVSQQHAGSLAAAEVFQTGSAASWGDSVHSLMAPQIYETNPWLIGQQQLDRQHQPLQVQSGARGLAQLGVLNEANVSVRQMEDYWQDLCEMHTMSDTTVVRSEAEVAADESYVSVRLPLGEAFIKPAGKLPNWGTVTAVGDQPLPPSAPDSSLLTSNAVLNSNWLQVATTSSSLVPSACQTPAMESVVQPAAAAVSPVEATGQQQEVPLSSQTTALTGGATPAASAGDNILNPTASLRLPVAAVPVPALVTPMSALSQPFTAVAAPVCHTPRSDQPGLSTFQGLSGIPRLVAAGQTLAVDGLLSCVSLAWLQSQLPPHCQLQHILHGTGGVVGMFYSQTSSAVAGGQLWGSAVWDGSCFRYSPLYGTAPEAISLCCSVMEVVAGCSSQQHEQDACGMI